MKHAVLALALVLLPFASTGTAAIPPLAGACPHVVVDVLGTVYYASADFGSEHWVDDAVYVESNGLPGLQRGGVTLLGDPDPFCPTANPDLRVS